MLRNRNLYPTVDPPLLSQHGGSVTEGFNLTLNSGAGTIYYTVDGSDPRLPGGGVSPSAQSMSVTQNTHVAIGSQWRYWDRGSLPAANWQTAAYNDSSWSTGTAPLGYGSGNEATVISYGANAQNKYRSSYFRKSFNVANPAAITSLTLGLVRDDGAIVYLNGTEVARSNMPAGTVTYGTSAASTVSGNDKYLVFNFTVPQNLVVAGSNVLAVEVHQINATSGDLRFDLSLTDTALPGLTLYQNTSFKSRLLSGGTWSALSEAVFHVAHPLIAAGPYVLDQWNESATAGTYPQAMRFFQTDTPDPVLATPMDAPWTLPYDLTTRSRINGLGADGISFVNTGSVQNTTGAGFVGAAVLALNTQGAQDIRVTWTGGTLAPNVRDQGIRLQYRVGGGGDYVDVAGFRRQPGRIPAQSRGRPFLGHRSGDLATGGGKSGAGRIAVESIISVVEAVDTRAQLAAGRHPGDRRSGGRGVAGDHERARLRTGWHGDRSSRRAGPGQERGHRGKFHRLGRHQNHGPTRSSRRHHQPSGAEWQSWCSMTSCFPKPGSYHPDSHRLGTESGHQFARHADRRSHGTRDASLHPGTHAGQQPAGPLRLPGPDGGPAAQRDLPLCEPDRQRGRLTDPGRRGKHDLHRHRGPEFHAQHRVAPLPAG